MTGVDADPVTRPVVVGVDGSEPSQAALRWAAEAAMARDLPLAIMYAVRPPGLAGEAEAHYARAEAASGAILGEARQWALDRFPDLVCTTEFAHEDPAAALLDASERADVVVVGSRGHGGFRDLLLGSTSLHTAMHAQCPVVVVRPNVPAEGGAEGRIVVGVDGSPHGRTAVELAFAEADRWDRPVTAVHAYSSTLTESPSPLMPHVPDPLTDQRRAEELLDGELRPWRERYPKVAVDAAAVQGSPSAALVKLSHGAHLVAVGSRGRGGFAALILGSVGHALIHHAGCPVLIAHHPAGQV